jgi:hypothetical protein
LKRRRRLQDRITESLFIAELSFRQTGRARALIERCRESVSKLVEFHMEVSWKSIGRSEKKLAREPWWTSQL